MSGARAVSSRPLVGCSGWQYRHWLGSFYPVDLPQPGWFAAYAAHFRTVEINSSYYHWPPAATFRRWRALAPPGFRYVIKAPRFATHMNRLADAARLIPELSGRLLELGETCAGMLWQLPPSLAYQPARLAAILAAVPADGRHAFEFRHASWHVPEVHARLDAHRCGCVVHDHRTGHAPRVHTGGFTYLRLHGWHENNGSYPTYALADWAAWLATAPRGSRVVCYFNNDLWAAAPHNALELAALLGQPVPSGGVVSAGAARSW